MKKHLFPDNKDGEEEGLKVMPNTSTRVMPNTSKKVMPDNSVKVEPEDTAKVTPEKEKKEKVLNQTKLTLTKNQMKVKMTV